jgi:hypothetical protein
MKSLIWLAIGFMALSAIADDTVKGYTKKDGTYVEPYHRTAPNDKKDDNYSSKGNVNPYTGEKGYVDPNKPTEPKTNPDPFKPKKSAGPF